MKILFFYFFKSKKQTTENKPYRQFTESGVEDGQFALENSNYCGSGVDKDFNKVLE